MYTPDDAATIFLGFSRLKGIGFKTLRDLGGVDAIAKELVAVPQEFCERFTRESQPADIQDHILRAGEEAWSKLNEHNIGLVRFTDRQYPEKFNALGDKRPLWFFYRGNVDLLAQSSLAVVGTRSPSSAGEFLARYAVAATRELNMPVVSGLAKGIDEMAHEWALLCGVPNISVLGTGLLKTYPMKNVELANRIVNAGGVLISEYMPSTAPAAENFVWRNRLQAALARCVIAPEWKSSSGTAHTIRFAKQMERLTINLKITGTSPPNDHGEADVVFEVPAQHSELIQALGTECGKYAVAAKYETPIVTPLNQSDLF